MKFFALLIVAVLFVACGDESSSSAPAPDLSEESSSSVEKTNESSSSVKPTSSEDKRSSSSVKKEDSSSSAEKASSSSVTPKSSSEEVKLSSSSVVASSSSVKSSSSVSPKSSSSKQNPWGTDNEWSPFNCKAFGGCLEFTDKRNNRTYKYLEFKGNDTLGNSATIHAMVENLNIGEMIGRRQNQEDDTKIERYCYDGDTLNCHYYGGLYQWAEMMQLPFECNTKSCADLIKPNHQGICPDGWRLLTYNDYYIVVHSNGNQDGVKGTRSTFGFGGSNDTGFSLVGAGYLWDYKFKNLNETTYWHYPEEARRLDSETMSFMGYQNRTSTAISDQDSYKTHGLSVRCVMVE